MDNSFTTLPTVKGSITLPVKIRQRYNITQETPLVIQDEGHGVITIKIMKMMAYDGVVLQEKKNSLRLSFPEGLDPSIIIKKIDELDG